MARPVAQTVAHKWGDIGQTHVMLAGITSRFQLQSILNVLCDKQ